ncbi:hypothetical protein [uncultured Chitinophaga sp.]|uniref:hypothetical protein n=1 Tax=uncultured Chitinophaga sp. TaxID=339340 RepID=UPI0025D51071|nr:hypothetical protein [uncultured Chitinophaga sp.]
MPKSVRTKPSDSTAEKKVSLTYQQLFSYTLFVITFGASVYTFFNAIPKLEALNKDVNKLDKDISVLTERVENIKANRK